MNKINTLFLQSKKHKLLSVYFCAGSPQLDSTVQVLHSLQSHGVDMVEVGIPFSDPLADGPVIQTASTLALRNGMSLSYLFGQLESVKDEVQIPIILMGYLNVIMHYGIEHFCKRCSEVGVSGMIIPDLPFRDYMETVKPIADKYDLRVIMMITPETSEERIRLIDQNTEGFIYMVSSASTTGAQSEFDEKKLAYFKRIESMNLRNERLIGFGISNRQTLDAAWQHSRGAIIGSKFVTILNKTQNTDQAVEQLLEVLKQ